MTGIRFGERARQSGPVGNLTLRANQPDENGWVRPADWPVFPALQDNRFFGLIAVDNVGDDAGYVSLSCTVTGGYTVDWGDGTVDNVASGTQADHQYVYSTFQSPITSRGYKIALVKVYPQSANNITAFDLQKRHATVGAVTYEAGWLEGAVSASAMTSLVVGSPTPLVAMSMLEKFTIDKHAMTSGANLFYNCTGLHSVPLFDTSAFTSFSRFFSACSALRSVPAFVTSAATNTGTMFAACTSLRSLPRMNARSTTSASNAYNAGISLRSSGVYAIRIAHSYASCSLSPTALNTIYTNLAGLGTKSCTATGTGSVMTYTTSTAHPYIEGQLVSVTGMTPTGYNISNQVITSVPSSTTFTVAGTATGSGTGGTANGGSATTITVTGNWGVATDDPTIATNKGWTVTG